MRRRGKDLKARTGYTSRQHKQCEKGCRVWTYMGFLGGPDGKESACNAGDPDLILVWEETLEEEMALHYSILAWRIPWIEELGGLPSTGLQRVRHDWTILQQFSSSHKWSGSNHTLMRKNLKFLHGRIIKLSQNWNTHLWWAFSQHTMCIYIIHQPDILKAGGNKQPSRKMVAFTWCQHCNF